MPQPIIDLSEIPAAVAAMYPDALARMSGILWTVEKDTLAIWNPGQARQIPSTTISKDTGLVGYPALTASAIIVTTEYQGTLKFGAPITVKSGLQSACGSWYVTFIEYALDCMAPGGSWFTTIESGKIGVGDNG